MKVRELLELIPALERADPEDVVLISATANSIILLNTRPGLQQGMDKVADCALTDWDREFLHSLGISLNKTPNGTR
jgi:hypothetical protein